MERTHYTAKELAEMTGMSPEFFRKLMRSGELPFYSLGRFHKVAVNDYEKWLESKRVQHQKRKRRTKAKTNFRRIV